MNPIVVAQGRRPGGATSPSRRRSSRRSSEEKTPARSRPEAAWPKIIEGKVNKWFTEVTLLGQDNVWDPPGGHHRQAPRRTLGKKLGGEVKIHAFVRYSLGEGIEKKVDDLAAEVAKTIGS